MSKIHLYLFLGCLSKSLCTAARMCKRTTIGEQKEFIARQKARHFALEFLDAADKSFLVRFSLPGILFWRPMRLYHLFNGLWRGNAQLKREARRGQRGTESRGIFVTISDRKQGPACGHTCTCMCCIVFWPSALFSATTSPTAGPGRATAFEQVRPLSLPLITAPPSVAALFWQRR